MANVVVYVGGGGNNQKYMSAFNASTGGLLWSYAAGGAVWTNPTITNGIAYFGSLDGNIYALNASTGAKLWSFSYKTNQFPPPDYETPSADLTVANGVVYAGISEADHGYGSLYALNASTGALLWNSPWSSTDGVSAAPVVADGVGLFSMRWIAISLG